MNTPELRPLPEPGAGLSVSAALGVLFVCSSAGWAGTAPISELPAGVPATVAVIAAGTGPLALVCIVTAASVLVGVMVFWTFVLRRTVSRFGF